MLPAVTSPTTSSSPKRSLVQYRTVISRVKTPASLQRQQTRQQDRELKSWRLALKASESRYGFVQSSEEFLGSVRSSLADMFQHVNPSLEKNLNRMNLLKEIQGEDTMPKLTQSTPRVLTSPSSIRPQDMMHIDKFYEHPASSLAVNKLPLPGSPYYNSTMFHKKTSSIAKIPLLTEFQLEDEIEAASQAIFKLMPTEETLNRQEIDGASVAHPTTALQFCWSIKPVSGIRPESREGASLLVLDRKIYLFGGQSMVKRNDIRMMNPDTGVWTIVSTYYSPKGRIGHSLCPYKNQLFLFGGWSHYSNRLRMRRCYKKVYVLTLSEENKWQRYACGGDIPKSRRDHAMAGIGSSMLIFGGIDAHSQVLKSCRLLDMENLRWTKLPIHSRVKPGRRSLATLTPVFPYTLFNRWDFSIFNIEYSKIDNAYGFAGFYLFGGLSDKDEPLNDLWVLKSLSQFTWQELVPSGRPPTPRFGHTTTFMGQMLLIYGGRNDSDPSSTKGSLNNVVILRLDALRWELVNLLGTIPDGRWGHCAVALGSKLIVFGGLNYTSFVPADVYILETDQTFVQEWLKLEDAKEEKVRVKRKLTKRSA